MKRLYTRRDSSRPVGGLVVGIAALVWAIVILIFTEPKWWWEGIVIFALFWGMLLTAAWMTRSRRWGIISAVFGVGLLLLRRFEVLDWTTLALWLILLGGASYASIEKES